MTLALRCAKHSKASYGTSAFNDGEFPHLPDESDASYAKRGTVAAIRRFVGPDIEAPDILECCSGSSVYDVAHYIALDNSVGAVVLAFRGTAGVEDAFTDLAAEDTGYALSTGPGKDTLSGLAHVGIAASARAKYLSIIGTVERAVSIMFAPRKGKQESQKCNSEGEKVDDDDDDDFIKVKPFVLVTGHSLGGGVASLVALDVASRHPEWRVEAYTFGSAGSLSENISQSEYARKIVRAFVMRDDVVPRMSLASLEWLKCLAKYVADYANDAPSSAPQSQGSQKTFFDSAFEWTAKKAIGGTNVDMNAAIEAARKEFAARNPSGPKFLYPAGRLFWVKPKPPPPPPKPLTASAPSGDCAPPLPPKPRKSYAGDGECPPPLPPKNRGSENTLAKSDNDAFVLIEDEESKGKDGKEEKEDKKDMFKFGMDICETLGVKWLEEIPLTDTFITDHYMKNYLSAMNEFFK